MPKNKYANRRAKRKEKPNASSSDWDQRHAASLQLHESEKLLVGILIVLLLFLPWALGTTHVLAQAAACFLALAAFGAALLPRHGDAHSITSSGQCKRLLGFPVFWFGSLFLVFIALQGFNPAWRVEGTEGFPLFTEQDPIGWLPSGVAGGELHPFQYLLIAGTPFLAVCAAWIGVTRRRSIVLLLSATAINGFFIAAVGFYQLAKNKSEILGFFRPPTERFLSTFPYHWQGAAYLIIVLAATIGLAAHHYAQARRTFKRSNPSGLFVFIGLVLTLILLFSFSQVSAAVATGLAVAFLTHIGYRELSVDALPSRKVFLASIALACTGAGAYLGGEVAENYIDRGDRSFELQAGVAQDGTWSASWEAGAAMFRQQPLFGWGAGSLINAYPEVLKREDIEPTGSLLTTEYAASDWIRLPAEFGIVGMVLLLLLAGSLARHYFDRRTLENPLVGFLLIGTLCGLLLGISSLVFTNVAFLTTWSLFFTLGIILIRIERAIRSRGEEAPA